MDDFIMESAVDFLLPYVTSDKKGLYKSFHYLMLPEWDLQMCSVRWLCLWWCEIQYLVYLRRIRNDVLAVSLTMLLPLYHNLHTVTRWIFFENVTGEGRTDMSYQRRASTQYYVPTCYVWCVCVWSDGLDSCVRFYRALAFNPDYTGKISFVPSFCVRNHVWLPRI